MAAHPEPPPPYKPPEPENQAPLPPTVIQVVPQSYHQLVGPEPMQLVCNNCGQHVTSEIRYETGLKTWFCIRIILILGIILIIPLLFVCVPFCMDSVKDVEHFCPNCGQYYGRYRRI